MHNDIALILLPVLVLTLLCVALVIAVATNIQTAKRQRRVIASYDDLVAAKNLHIASLENLRDTQEMMIGALRERCALLGDKENAHADA